MSEGSTNSLPQQISQHFNLDELRGLCHDLGIEYENLRGETRDAKVLALVLYCQRYGSLSQLQNLLQARRPFITWHFNKAPSTEPDEVEQQYRQRLASRYYYLDIRGMGQASRQPVRLPLEAIYVPLNGRVNRIFSPTNSEQATQQEPVQPLLTLLQNNDGLIVLGAPGAGKTTWLKYLALQCTGGNGEALGLGDRLPLMLSLSAYATALVEKDVPLSQFLATFYKNLGFALPLDSLIETALAQGNALLLLDGLDEVADPNLRHLLVNRLLDFFTIQQPNGNKFVITSRPAGYEAVRLMADGLVECTVMPLDKDQVEQFVNQWTAALSQQSPPETAVSNPDQLLVQITENSAVQALATSPLLLTILLLLLRQGISLPHKRVALYDLYLRTLLHDWQTARSLDRPPKIEQSAAEILEILTPFALWMHESSPQRSHVKTAAARQHLIAHFTNQNAENPAQAADDFLQAMLTATGLFVNTAPDSVGFLHLSFQEFSAALALAKLGLANEAALLAEIQVRLAEIGWHEVILLTLGIVAVVEHRPEATNALMRGLLPNASPETTLLLAETAVILAEDGIEKDVKTAVIQSTLQSATMPTHNATLRVQAGRLLGQLGDPRPESQTVDKMLFCYVPGGAFWLGHTDQAMLYEQLNEPYWLGTFPVTQAQFAQFVAAGGYEQAEFWAEAASVNRWRLGEVMGWEQHGWRSAPFEYGRPFNLPNHPVVGITWYEALAFTRWLTERWRQQGTLPAGWQVQLPSEVAWEKGARGGLKIPRQPRTLPVTEAMQNPEPAITLTQNPTPKRSYPGQTSLTPQVANINDTAVATSSAVGCFLQPSPVGCQELCGNVWEWTASRFRPYPYDPQDGREVPDVKLFEEMVLRGGAYWSDVRSANVTFRARRSPNEQNSSFGFRVMLAKYSVV